MPLKLLTHAEQVATHLRGEILSGRWQDELPGEGTLQSELGVNHSTVGAALCLLEKQGLLVSQGVGRRRRIVLPKGASPPGLRIGLFLYETTDLSAYDVIRIKHRLMESDHRFVIPDRCLTELGMDVPRIARAAAKAEVDAWVVFSASLPVLEWFSKQPLPVMAYAGEFYPRLSLAFVGIRRPLDVLVRRLVALGHRRIVLLTRSPRRPHVFLRVLEEHSVPVGDYNMPVWETNPEGFRRCLDMLFAATPPTAMLIDEADLFMAAKDHLARKGFGCPGKVSLICADPDPAFRWFEPSVAHIRWDMVPLIHRIGQWADNIARGRDDHRQTFFSSEFVEGGTLGPAMG